MIVPLLYGTRTPNTEGGASRYEWAKSKNMHTTIYYLFTLLLVVAACFPCCRFIFLFSNFFIVCGSVVFHRNAYSLFICCCNETMGLLLLFLLLIVYMYPMQTAARRCRSEREIRLKTTLALDIYILCVCVVLNWKAYAAVLCTEYYEVLWYTYIHIIMYV